VGNEELAEEVRALRSNQARLELELASMTVLVKQLRDELRSALGTHPPRDLHVPSASRTYAMVTGPKPLPVPVPVQQLHCPRVRQQPNVAKPAASPPALAIQSPPRPSPPSANNDWSEVNRKRRSKKLPGAFAVAFAKEAPLEELSDALIGGKVPRHRKYQSVFVNNLGQRCSFKVIRQALVRAGVKHADILHLSWIETSILHIVTYEDTVEHLGRIIFEKLKLSSSTSTKIDERTIEAHFKEQTTKTMRISVQGFFKRRCAELSGESLSVIPVVNQE
jgi:hypothetical protein